MAHFYMNIIVMSMGSFFDSGPSLLSTLFSSSPQNLGTGRFMNASTHDFSYPPKSHLLKCTHRVVINSLMKLSRHCNLNASTKPLRRGVYKVDDAVIGGY